MALTKGSQNTINKKISNIEKFWELNKLTKIQQQENKVRTQEKMIKLAKDAIANNEITDENKYFEFVNKFANAEVVTNKFGRKLFVKLG